MTSPHTGQTPSITYYPFSTQPLRTMQTQGQVAAYRRLAIAILGLDVATRTRELRKDRGESQHAQKAA